MEKWTEEHINYLESLAAGEMPKMPEYGLCENFCDKFRVHLPEELVKDWEHYSGDLDYWVPATRKGLEPYEQYYKTRNLWIRKQGELRRDLCRHIARKIKEEMSLY
jgi:hypothetical protein